MSRLAEAAGRRHVRRVQVQYDDGHEEEAVVHLPVGVHAARFIADYREYLEVQAEFAALVEVLPEVPTPDLPDDASEEEVAAAAQRVFRERMDKADLEERKLVDQAAAASSEAFLAFAVKWLPHLVPEIKDEEAAGNVLYESGGQDSALVKVLPQLASHVHGRGKEGLDTLPFG